MALAAEPLRREAVRLAVERQFHWLWRHGPCSQDQYDFWAWSVGGAAKTRFYAGGLAGKLAVAPEVALDAAIPASRRLVRAPKRFPIADAHWVTGALALAKADQLEGALGLVEDCLSALRASRSPGFDEYAWGYPFDWVTCFGTFPAGTPLITTIPYVYAAFEAAHDADIFGPQASVLESIGRFAFADLPDTVTRLGARASSYTPGDSRRVVNASAYRGWLLVSAGLRFGRQEWIERALEYLQFVLDTQRADGSWLYAVDGRDAFIDNFHTCFVIKNLMKAGHMLAERPEAGRLLDAVARGYAYYKRSLLDDDGQPLPFALTQRRSLVRRELYDYAEGINLATLVKDVDPGAAAIRAGLVHTLLTGWQLDDGHFVTRRTVFGTNKVPYHRWAQSQTFNALCQLLAEDS